MSRSRRNPVEAPMQRHRLPVVFGLALLLLWTACTGGDLLFYGRQHEAAPHGPAGIIADDGPQPLPDHRFNQLFTRYGPGWTGGDGTYSVPLPDGRTAWLFGDTFLGRVNPDRSRPPQSPFIRNALVLQEGNHLFTRHGQQGSTAGAFLVPASGGQWYWPADGTVVNRQLWVFFRRMTSTGSGMWQWRYVGTDLATFTLPEIRLKKVSFLAACDKIRFGAAIMETGRFIYIYGTEDGAGQKFMCLARVRAGPLDDQWQYYTGSRWVTESSLAGRLLAGVVEQFSVVEVGPKVCLVTIDGRVPFSNRIVAYFAEAPTGPWHGPETVYIAPEARGDVVAYNACVHPQFTDDAGRVLISYNLNHVSDPAAAYADADVYRPRFIRVNLKQLLPP